MFLPAKYLLTGSFSYKCELHILAINKGCLYLCFTGSGAAPGIEASTPQSRRR